VRTARKGSLDLNSQRGDILACKARILDLRKGQVAGERGGNCAIPV
jgi:hypothetical protein